MKNKYFTPDIEDFHIGYEYEYEDIIPSGSSDYFKSIISKPSEIENLFKGFDTGMGIRVPYLTKEQIETEGWELIQIYPTGACIFQKGTKEKGCELTYDFQEHRVHFTKLYFYGLDDEYTRTKLTWSSLECKDINTFKKIIKLLGI